MGNIDLKQKNRICLKAEVEYNVLKIIQRSCAFKLVEVKVTFQFNEKDKMKLSMELG